ncbi:MAG: T9SS type A sorting domain-containing protein [Crocinitomicaceae bacterium]
MIKQRKSKIIVQLGIVLLMGSISYSQSIAPQSVNNSGSTMSQSNGSLSFTVGELTVQSQTDSQGNTLGSGFTAGASLTTMSVQETNAAILDVKVYPNPTTELVNIQINHSTVDQVIVTVADLEGKEVYSGKYLGIANVIGINISSYATGSYLLTLKNTSNQLLGTYKIIKH